MALYEKGIRALFAAGGTAGHIVPALTIAERIKERYPSSTIYFVGTESGMEGALVLKRGFSFLTIKAHPFRGGLKRVVNFLTNFPSSLSEAISVVRGTDPNVVVGTGGYVSVPTILAAKLLGIPTLIHIQNVSPGLASLCLSFFASEIHTAFPGTEKRIFWRSRKKLFVSGNPVTVRLPEKVRDEIINEMNLHHDFFTILVTGGSQGSKAINRAVLDIVKASLLPDNIQIIWQTGYANYDEIENQREDFRMVVHLAPFFENMNEVYSVSDLVICRAGALTLSEVASWGLPSIVIPYRGAGGHQKKNAQYFERAGAAVVIPENELSAPTLAREIIKIYTNEPKRHSMIRAARKLSREGGTDFIVDHIVNLVFQRRRNV